ncbi:hypothetical protein OH799_04095 [Nocardia sp. NBC_00881]|uniref:hypothetical protein n=1 Tax=Nocardia sp. NBC_00881 TaxID=2975995 RepID=UPI003864CFE9|nr:hypothetical protein OH799_04095 [Nocardia sp. NBC_00881]
MRAQRNSALIELAGELPGPILAQTADIHISTAVRWSTLAARDWTHYLAAHERPLDQ